MQLFRLAALLSLVFCQDCPAGFVLQFSPDGLDTSRTVNVGDNFSVNLYLAQTSPSTGLTSIGLFSFGTRASFSGSVLQANPGVISAVFNSLFSDMTLSSGQIETHGALPDPVPVQNVIYLATYDFTALAEGVTQLTIGDLDFGQDDFTLADATIDDPTPTVLDVDLFGPALTGTFTYQINVSAVPEPSSLALTTVVSAVLLGLRRRSKRS